MDHRIRMGRSDIRSDHRHGCDLDALRVRADLLRRIGWVSMSDASHTRSSPDMETALAGSNMFSRTSGLSHQIVIDFPTLEAMQIARDAIIKASAPARPSDGLSSLRQAIIDNTRGDLFWIGEILLGELEKETGFKGDSDIAQRPLAASSLQPDSNRLRRCINMAMGCLDPLSSNADERLAWHRLLDAMEGREPRPSVPSLSATQRDGAAE
jgi:hypothetical protein